MIDTRRINSISSFDLQEGKRLRKLAIEEYRQGKSLAESYRLFRNAAELGDETAQVILGALTFNIHLAKELDPYTSDKQVAENQQVYLVNDYPYNDLIAIPEFMSIDLKTARKYFLENKKKGDPFAAYNYYVCLAMGIEGNKHEDIALSGFEHILLSMLGVPPIIQMMCHFWLAYLYDKQGGENTLTILIKKKFPFRRIFALPDTPSKANLHLHAFLDLIQDEDNAYLQEESLCVYALTHLSDPLMGKKPPAHFDFEPLFMHELPGFLGDIH